MEHINRIELQGRIGTVRTNVVNGSKVANFSLATEYLYKSRDAGAVSETTWHNVVVWENRDMPDIDRIKVGMPVYVAGRLRASRYTAADGKEKTFYEVMAQKMRFVTNETAENAI